MLDSANCLKCCIRQFPASNSSLEVNKGEYGNMDLFESAPGMPMVRKLPSWGRAQNLLGNLCWLEDLFMSNTQRLQTRVQSALARVAVGPQCEQPKRTLRKRLMYRKVPIAGDGRCGWRSLAASRDLALYETIPRTFGYKVLSVMPAF